MTKTFQEIDDELDAELIALYASDEQTDSLADASTESDEPAETDSTEVDTPAEASTEPTVPESRYHAAVVAMNRAQQDLADIKKNTADKDAYIQQLQQQLQGNSSTQATDDDMGNAQDNYPEIVTPLLKKISALEARLSAVSDDMGNVKTVTNRIQHNETKTADEVHRDAIKAAHTDAYELSDNPDFVSWQRSQAPMVQQALSNGTAQDVIAALDLYRVANPKKVASAPGVKTNSKLEQAKLAATPNIRTGHNTEQKATYTTAQIEKMSRQEFMKHEAAIDDALSRGEVF